MPRKSAAAAAVSPRVDARGNRLQPPSDMDDASSAVFRRLTASNRPSHFTHADIELLRAFAEAAVLATQAYKELRAAGPVIAGRPSPWLTVQEKSVRALGVLAPKLRLGPSARTDPKTTARGMPDRPPSIYDTLGWTTEAEQ